MVAAGLCPGRGDRRAARHYRFLATFEQGAAACGEEIKFFVDVASAEMPTVDNEVVLLGPDAGLARWLTAHGIKHRPLSPVIRRPVAR